MLVAQYGEYSTPRFALKRNFHSGGSITWKKKENQKSSTLTKDTTETPVPLKFRSLF